MPTVTHPQEFFLSVKDLLRHYESSKCIENYAKFREQEKELNRVFYDCQSAVHHALCGECGYVLLPMI